jgi:hypothetical protein
MTESSYPFLDSSRYALNTVEMQSSYLGLRLIERTPSQYPNSEIRELLSNSEPPHQLTLSNHGAYASGWVGARHMHRPVCRTMARFALLPRP